MQEPRTLCDLSPMEYAFIERLACTGSIRRRLQDIGLVPQTKVICVGSSPSGDPKAYLIRGAVIAIRREDAQNIWIQNKEDSYGCC